MVVVVRLTRAALYGVVPGAEVGRAGSTSGGLARTERRRLFPAPTQGCCLNDLLTQRDQDACLCSEKGSAASVVRTPPSPPWEDLRTMTAWLVDSRVVD